MIKNTVKKISFLFLISIILLLSSCGGGDNKTECNHEYGEYRIIQEGTCQQEQIEEATCLKCGNPHQRYTGFKDHFFEKIHEFQANCLEPGYIEYRCAYCNEHKREETSGVTGHHHIETYRQNPTCREPGYVEYRCEHCGDCYTDTLEMINHNYLTNVIEPTCESEGYTEYHCDMCGDSYQDNHVEPLGHDFIEYHIMNEFELKYGMPVDIEAFCHRCNMPYHFNLPSISEDFYQIEVNGSETCGESKIFNCKYYDENSKLQIEFNFSEYNNHNEEYIPEKLATCEENGYSGHYKCITCGQITSQYEIYYAFGHNYGYIVNTFPTFETDGLLTYICCNDSTHRKEEVIPAFKNSDEYSITINRESTCTSEGHYVYRYQLKEISTQRFVFDYYPPLKDHDYHYYDKVDATCEKPGHYEYRECMECHDNNYEEIPALNHKYGEWQIDIEPTNYTNGSISRVCINDNTHVQKQNLPSLTSFYYTKIENVEATCEYDGYIKYGYTIDNQQLIIVSILEKLNHSYSEWQIDINPTDTEEGLAKKVCYRDSNHIISAELPILNSNEYEIAILTEPKCTEEGHLQYVLEVKDHESIYINVYKDLGGHIGGNATCIEKAVCERCNNSYGEFADHKYIYSFDETYHYTNCELCNLDLKSMHDYNKSYDFVDSTCTKNGHYKQDCTDENCGHTKVTTIVIKHDFQGEECRLCGLHTYTEGITFDHYLGPYIVKSFAGASPNQIIYLQQTYNDRYVVAINSSNGDDLSFMLELYLPNTIELIKENAFKNSNLQYLHFGKNTINNNPIVFKDNAFYMYNKLVGVYYDSSLVDWAENMIFESASSNPLFYSTCILNVTENGTNQYADLTNLAGLKKLNAYAFAGYDYTGSIMVLPNTLEYYNITATYGTDITNIKYEGTLEEWLKVELSNIIYDTTSVYFNIDGNYVPLSEVVIPNTLNQILPYSFGNFKSIETVTIPNTIKSIGKDAFKNCENIETVYFDGTLEEWLQIDFENEYSNPMYYAKDFYLRDSSNNYIKLVDVVIPTNITTINNYALYNIQSIKTINVHDNVTHIGYNAFGKTNSLTSLIIPFTGKELNATEYYHFGYVFGSTNKNNQLNSIPLTLKYLEVTKQTIFLESTFELVENITDFVFSKDVIEFGHHNEFYNNLENVYMKGTLKDWSYINFKSSSSNPMYNAEHLYLYNENNEFYELTDLNTANLPYVINYSYYGLDNLKTLVIDPVTTYIGTESFAKCTSLEELEIPETVNNIGTGAFCYCTNLSTVKFDANVEYIANNLFGNCESLSTLYFTNKVKEIKDYAFTSTKISNIYFKGSIFDWNSMYFDYDSTPLTASLDLYLNNDTTNEYYLLENLILDDEFTVLYEGHYRNIKSLKTVEITSSHIKELPYGVFSSCINLTSIKLADTIEELNNPFYESCSLETLNIPENTKYISQYTFFGLTNLKYNEHEAAKYLGSNTNPYLVLIGNGNNNSYLSNIHADTKFIEFYDDNGSHELLNGNFYRKYDEGAFTYIRSEDNDKFMLLGANQKTYNTFSADLSDVEYFYTNCFTHPDGTRIEFQELILPFIGHYNGDKTTYILEDLFGTRGTGIKPYIGKLTVKSGIIPEDAFYQITVDELILENVTHLYKNSIPSSITELYIPDSVTYIDLEFLSNYALTTLDMPFATNEILSKIPTNNLITLKIRNNMEDFSVNFYNKYKKLENLHLPANLKTFNKESVYQTNKKIKNLYFEGTLEDWMKVDYTADINRYISFEKIYYKASINSEIYNGYIQNDLYNVTEIGEYRFKNATGTLILPKTIKKISKNAFINANFEKVIYQGTFEDWLQIEFEDATSNPVNYTIDFSFTDSNLVLYKLEGIITIPENITEIKAYSLMNMTNVTEYIFHEGITTIQESAFYNNTSLTKIILPNSIIEIGSKAFYNCTSVKELTLPNNIEEIKDETFTYCNEIDTLIIPDSVISLGHRAISAKSINNVYLSKNTINYKNFSISGGNKAKIYYNSSLEDWINNANFIEAQNPLYGSSGCLYTLNENNEYELLEELYLNMDYLKPSTFYGIKLTKLTIGNNPIILGKSNFNAGHTLYSWYYDGTLEDYINNTIVEGSGSLPVGSMNQYFKDDNNEYYKIQGEIYIPNTITKINPYQFNHFNVYGTNNITKLYIPNSVKEIPSYFVDGIEVYYQSTIEETINYPISFNHISYILDNDGNYVKTSDIEVLDLSNYTNDTIKENQFSNMFFNNVKKIILPNTITNFEIDCFRFFDKVEKIYYNGTLEDWINITFESKYSNPMSICNNFYLLDEKNEYYLLDQLIINSTHNEIKAYQFIFKEKTNVYISGYLKIDPSNFENCTVYSDLIEKPTDWTFVCKLCSKF